MIKPVPEPELPWMSATDRSQSATMASVESGDDRSSFFVADAPSFAGMVKLAEAVALSDGDGLLTGVVFAKACDAESVPDSGEVATVFELRSSPAD